MQATGITKLEADVLVIGGGPAGAWAAWSAAKNNARVVLVDKGYLGSSGATAPGGTNLLYLPPDPELREQAVQQRYRESGYLAEPAWIHRVLDQVYESLVLVESWGYPFRRDEDGVPLRDHLQGPEYMKLMRRQVTRSGVRILDQSPALELLVDENGAGGARGISRLDGGEWEVRANAVVIATGGCAFLSKGLGCNVLTGDGLLMAAELGAELSGMEFTRQYAPSAAFGTNTRGRLLNWATYTAEDGTVLQAGGPRAGDFLPRMLSQGPVYAVLNHADTEEKRQILRKSHAIFFLPLDRAGIDPFTERFPLTLRYEGTVRGTGGLRLVGDDCTTTVPGLYAAGDAATRERVTGAKSGGGAFNASWAISSGTWSGAGAARHALAQGRSATSRSLQPAGRYGLEAGSGATTAAAEIDAAAVVQAVQREVFPLDINYFRSEPVLRGSLERLRSVWTDGFRGTVRQTVQARVRTREAAAMTATARWMYTAALGRRETRGLHALTEYPDADPAQQHRLIVSGIEEITIRPEQTQFARREVVAP
ncbi:Succinate dehydrogenase/fumarate reductase, flavoprotein subunit [Paenibacillus sp. UNCCL117]|uniref:FAD-dependent oxidoreductase n=1 Tax=unclassified Paenibacillus TaxID=185978 RepID=UPI00087F5D00|nr:MULTISPECIES: FAD-binding protein [unclassified Paenibacillus]SDD58024.1 Succinate dehydrogenase/fumarate reductase, flavoprotein subunit [Paenibacillus sp. cl123]SFW51076.1 Succinate dehydrogenase/fumarate reductase, flavoprotein subunit [Paenibacillus sp. UNCCL117]